MDRDFLIDLFSGFGPVAIRRMFSGFGISADGTNFALALRGGLYLRADEQTIPRFEAEGSSRFRIKPGPRPSPWRPTGSCRSGFTTTPRN
jgi:DNA transformation protein and related proteins